MTPLWPLRSAVNHHQFAFPKITPELSLRDCSLNSLLEADRMAFAILIALADDPLLGGPSHSITIHVAFFSSLFVLLMDLLQSTTLLIIDQLS